VNADRLSAMPRTSRRKQVQHEGGSTSQPAGNPHRTTRRNLLRLGLQACSQLDQELRLRAKYLCVEECTPQPGAQGTPRIDVGTACQAPFEVVVHHVVSLGAQFARHERVGQLTNIRTFHGVSGSHPLPVGGCRDCAEVGTKKGPSLVEP